MNDVFTWPVGRDGEADAEGSRRAPLSPVIAYVVACSVSGTVAGALLGLLGAVLREAGGLTSTSLLAAAAPIALVAAACQWSGRVRPLPQRNVQVPRRWLQWQRRTATAAAFGSVIGAGALTRLWHAVAWVLALMALAAPTWQSAAVCGTVYGGARGLGLLVTFVLDRTSRGRPDWDGIWMARSPASRALAPIALMSYGALIVAG